MKVVRVLGFLFLVILCHWAMAFPDGEEVIIYSPAVKTGQSQGPKEFSNYFDLEKDQLVWRNSRPDYGSSIHLLDLTSNQTSVLSQAPDARHEHYFSPPLSLSSGRVAWPNSVRNILLFDIPGWNESTVLSDGSHPDINQERANKDPFLHGDSLVWARGKFTGSSYDYDIFLLDLATGEMKEICTTPGDQDDPAMDRSRIVWRDQRDEPGNGDIYLFDLRENREIPICTAPDLQEFPKISGDYIVWEDYRDSIAAIYLYDILNGSEKRISEDYRRSGQAFISGNYVVWKDYPLMDRTGNPPGRILVRAIDSGKTGVLPIATKYPMLLDLDGNRVLYGDFYGDMKDGYLHLFVLDYPEPADGSISMPPSNSSAYTRLPIPGAHEQTGMPAAALPIAALLLALGLAFLLKSVEK
jgi:beta propeller repeat protein